MNKKQSPYQHKGGYKIPKNYFKDFEDSLWTKIEAEQQQFLNDKIGSGFDTPKGYFKNLSIEIPSKKESKIIRLFPKKTLQYAASIAAIFVLSLSVYNDYVTTNISFSNLRNETVQNYFEDGHINLQSPEIESIILQGEIATEIDFNKISDDALFDYLLNNTTEISLLNR